MSKIQDDEWIEYNKKPSIRSSIIKKMIKLGRTFVIKKDLYAARKLWDSYAKKKKVPQGFDVNLTKIAGVDCEWISPKDSKGKKIIIYLHGGGYVLGSLHTARSFAILLSKYTSEKILTVDYRLAPENPFPAGLEDSIAIYRNLLEDGVDSKDIIFAGDSAGGGLSLATTLLLKEKREPLPGAVVCISPWTDLAATGESNTANTKLDPIFGGGSGAIKPEDYAGKESLYNPLVSPLYGDYNEFPPLFIHVGTDEIILDDSIRLAKKAKEAGVEVSIKVWKGMWHVFSAQHDILPEAKQSLKEIARYIKGLDESS